MDLNVNKSEGLKWIFVTLLYSLFLLVFPILIIIFPILHLFSFHFLLILNFSFLNYFFIWRPIFDLFDPMAHPQHRLCWRCSKKLDPSILPPNFLQNQLGLNEGEVVLLLTRLHLHRSSQAGDEVGFLTSSNFIL